MSNDAPVIYLNRIERHYRQGDDRLDILKGAELAVWPGQSVALLKALHILTREGAMNADSRRKLKQVHFPDSLENVRGVGYRIR